MSFFALRWSAPVHRSTLPVLTTLVTLLAACVYAKALANGYALDDEAIIRLNPTVHGLHDLRGVLLGPYWPNSHELYRPVTLLSYAVEWSIFGDSPTTMHATNLLLHAAATAGVLLLAVRLGAPLLGAALGGVIFAVHPVHVEAVANLVGRAEILATLLVLLACHVHISARPSRAVRIALVALVYLLALGAKEIAVTLPAVLLLLDLFRAPRLDRRAWFLLWRQAPLWTAMAISLGVFLWLRSLATGGVIGTTPAPYLMGLSTAERLATALRLWPEYIRLLLWPADLAIDWGPDIINPVSWSHPLPWVGLAIGASLAALSVLLWNRERWVGLAVVWAAATIFPVSQIPFPIGVILAERTLYLPSVSVALLAPAAVHAARRLRAPLRPAAGFTLAALIAAGAWRTWQRAPIWQNTNTVFYALADDHPESYWVHWRIGHLLVLAGRPEEAVPWYERAGEKVRWNHFNMNMDYTSTLLALGNANRAEEISRHTLRNHPKSVAPHVYISASLFDQGRFREALPELERALEKSPADPNTVAIVSHHRALIYDALGRPDSALAHRRISLEHASASGSGPAWYHMARLNMISGDPAKALVALDSARSYIKDDYRTALTLDPLPELRSPLIRGWGSGSRYKQSQADDYAPDHVNTPAPLRRNPPDERAGG